MESRQERYSKKRSKSTLRRIIWAIVIIFVLLIGYSIFEYFMGKQSAEDDMESFNNSEQLEEFRDDFQGADTGDVTNVLLVGMDSDGANVSRTDTIMIGQFDSSQNEAKLVSIMRDSLVSIPGHGQNKINAAFAFGGPELLRQTIEENFGIKVSDYALVNFKGFENIVDTIAPGGVAINVEKDMQYTSQDGRTDINLQAGKQELNGAELLDYARFRSDAEADFGRVRRQQQVMSVLKDEMVSFTGLLRMPRAVGSLEPYVNTSMSTGAMVTNLGSYMLNTPDEIETLRVPVENSYRNARYEGAGAVLDLDLEANQQALNDFLNE